MPSTFDKFIDSLPDDRKAAVAAMREVIAKSIPKGFEERIGMGGIMWAVPHSLFPAGYHCDPLKPLMLMSLTSTKGHVALHHMGLYGSGPLMNWFTAEWAETFTEKTRHGQGMHPFQKPRGRTSQTHRRTCDQTHTAGMDRDLPKGPPAVVPPRFT